MTDVAEKVETEETETFEEVETEETEEVVEASEETEEETEEAEVADWMQEDDSDAEVMPVSAHIKKKEKLKGKIQEKDSEIEALRKEIETLKSPATDAPVKTAERPKRDDFDDDDEWAEALEDYLDNKADMRGQGVKQQEAAKQAQKKVQEQVDAHFDRADELIEKHGISAEAFKASDQKVRETVHAVVEKSGGNGDFIVDNLIARIGEGSEKVLFYIGRNKSELAKLQSSLINDPTGIEAAILLGEIRSRVSGTTKKPSKAPSPAASAKGGEGGTGQAKALERKYKEAHKAKDTQKAFNLKQEAKRAGVDTSKW
jgi:hypothetical protein